MLNGQDLLFLGLMGFGVVAVYLADYFSKRSSKSQSEDTVPIKTKEQEEMAFKEFEAANTSKPDALRSAIRQGLQLDMMALEAFHQMSEIAQAYKNAATVHHPKNTTNDFSFEWTEIDDDRPRGRF